MSSLQAPGAVVMIRPHHFRSNPETSGDNAFQTLARNDESAAGIQALAEFDQAVAALREAGVTVHVFDDEGTETPDSVFPNNWFSTHAGGHIAIYPMFAPNRRKERRWDVIEMLKRDYRVQDVIDYSGLERDGLALEGTGAMVLDHIGRIAYTVQSNRADPVLLERFCTSAIWIVRVNRLLHEGVADVVRRLDVDELAGIGFKIALHFLECMGHLFGAHTI